MNDYLTDDDRADNSHGVVELAGTGGWTLRGLTIAAGNRTGNGGLGGGLRIIPRGASSVTTISHCLFIDNSAPDTGGGGGAVYATASGGEHTVNLFYCLFHENEVKARGMAVMARLVSLNIINCTLHKNKATESGSGVVSYTMSPSSGADISNNVFYKNTANGVIYRGNDVSLSGGNYKELRLHHNMIQGEYQGDYVALAVGTRSSVAPCVGFESETITDVEVAGSIYMAPLLASGSAASFDGGYNGARTRTKESVGSMEEFTLSKDIYGTDLDMHRGAAVDIGAVESRTSFTGKELRIVEINPKEIVKGYHKFIIVKAENYDDRIASNNKLYFAEDINSLGQALRASEFIGAEKN